MESRPSSEALRRRPGTALGLAALLFVLIYGLSLYWLPQVFPVRALLEALPWIAASDVTQVSFLVLSLLCMVVLGRGDLRRFGFRGARPGFLVRAVVLGLGGSLVLLVLGSLVQLAILGHPPRPGTESPLPQGLTLRSVISVWVLASACEEVFYRGLLQNLLEPLKGVRLGLGRWRVSLPVLGCGLAFGLGHLCLLPFVPLALVVQIVVSATWLGVLAGLCMERSGSLLPCYLVHVSFNITGMVLPALLGA